MEPSQKSGGVRINHPRHYLLILMVLLLSGLACGLANPEHQPNNEVRQAVFTYEQANQGPVKDLVIHFRRDEPRLRFEGQNQNGGHTVWLYPAGGQEYFATRPQAATYLYIQEIEYSNNQTEATVKIYRGDGSGYQGWQLNLSKQAGGGWAVVNRIELESEPSE